MHLDGTAQDVTPLPSSTYLSVTYHPSGEAFAFAVDQDGSESIWVSSNIGKTPGKVVFSDVGTKFGVIGFEVDGRHLLYAAQHSDNHAELHRIDVTDPTTAPVMWSGPVGRTNLKVDPGSSQDVCLDDRDDVLLKAVSPWRVRRRGPCVPSPTRLGRRGPLDGWTRQDCSSRQASVVARSTSRPSTSPPARSCRSCPGFRRRRTDPCSDTPGPAAGVGREPGQRFQLIRVRAAGRSLPEARSVVAAETSNVTDEGHDQQQEHCQQAQVDPRVGHPAREHPARVIREYQHEVEDRADDEYGDPQ